MSYVMSFSVLNWFYANIADARLLKQQLLWSLCWNLTVGACRWNSVCVDFLVDSIVTKKLVASDSDSPSK